MSGGPDIGEQLSQARADRDVYRRMLDDVCAVLARAAPFMWSHGTRMEADACRWQDEAVAALHRVEIERADMVEEVNGGHCSCHGLENQWEPEETSAAAVRMRAESQHWGVEHERRADVEAALAAWEARQ